MKYSVHYDNFIECTTANNTGEAKTHNEVK